MNCLIVLLSYIELVCRVVIWFLLFTLQNRVWVVGLKMVWKRDILMNQTGKETNLEIKEA